MSRLPAFTDPNLLISGATLDDAAVYRISDDLAIVQTVDFFTPMVDDPYLFGQIAAANSLSDIYAMGGVPKTAMNVAAFPVNDVDLDVFEAILAGGADKLIEADTLLVGGHTIEDKEPKYGLSVTGFVHPNQILANRGARDGDLLVLTKPLGTGIISTAIKGELATKEQETMASVVMAQLNRGAFESLKDLETHACTDVTGFGLLGHAYEMISDSDVGFELWQQKIPLLPGTLDFAAMGLVPGGAHRNRCHLGDRILAGPEVSEALMDTLFDPQTSGGLLVALPEPQALFYLRQLGDRQLQGTIIGTVNTKHPGTVVVI